MIGKFLDQIKDKVEPLKKKLPFGNKDDEYEEYEDEEDEDEDDIDSEDSTEQIEIGNLDSEESELDDVEDDEGTDEDDEDDEDDDDEEDEDEDEEDTAKYKKKKLIQLGLIAVIGYLAVDSFLLSGEEDNKVPEVKKQVRKKRKPRKRKPRKNIKKVAKAKKIEKAEVKKVEKIPEVPKVVEEVKKPVEVPAVVAKVPPKPVVKPKEVGEANSKPMTNNNPEVKVPETLNLNTGKDQVKISEDGLMAKPEGKAQDKLSDQLTKIIKKVEEEKKIIDYKYSAPPKYENFGRSLVYNCKGKHWACVDKEAHFKCDKNQKWAKQKSKKAECVLSKIMATTADCRTMQLYNINMVVEVPDCK